MTYNLRQLGASVPGWLSEVEELASGFKFPPDALKYQGARGEGVNRMFEQDAALLLKDCRLIGANVSDNDQEIWLLSQAGEVFRVTGDGSARFYFVEESEYNFYLEDYATEEALVALSNLGIYHSENTPKVR